MSNQELHHSYITINSDRLERTDTGWLVKDAVPVVDDIVMNGIMYPSDELAKSYQGINGVPAPIGHPKDSNGDYISAFNGEALQNYYAGAICTNVRYKDGKVLMDININEAQARAHKDGSRMVDAINAGSPIHMSTGLYLQRLVKSGISKGKEYAAVAMNMAFDHVAILLDEPGGATPADGVGMFVNADQAIADAMEPEQEERIVNRLYNRMSELLSSVIPTGYTKPTEPVQTINADNGGEPEMNEDQIKELVAEAVKAAVEPVVNHLSELRSDMQANADAAKAAKVAEASEATGMEVDELKPLDVNALDKLIAKSKTAFGVNTGRTSAPAADEYIADDYSINALMETK